MTNLSRYRKSNRYITIDGETRLLIEWAEAMGINKKLIHRRINVFGWTEEDAVFTPPRKYAKKNALGREEPDQGGDDRTPQA